MTAPVLEKDFQALVVEAAGWTGWAVYHPFDSRRSSPGYPDLTMVHKETGRLLFVELKSAGGVVSARQREWLGWLGKRHEVHVWRPADWTSGVVLAALRGEAAA